MSTTEENKAQFRLVYEELLNGGNLEVAEELVAPDFFDHEAHPGQNSGPESMRGLGPLLGHGALLHIREHVRVVMAMDE